MIWYREYPSGTWRCMLRTSPPHTYSRPSDWLKNAENQMRGCRKDVLWRKQDEAARKLIWC